MNNFIIEENGFNVDIENFQIAIYIKMLVK